MAADTNLRINGTRLWDSLMEMAEIGATPKGGVKRLTLTDLDRQAAICSGDWCRKAGCSIDDRPHGLDVRAPRRRRRQPAAGDDRQPPRHAADGRQVRRRARRDGGARGRALAQRSRHQDAGIPIEICMWTNEEGSRFAPAMVASGVFAGAFTLEEASRRPATSTARCSARSCDAHRLRRHRRRSAAGRCTRCSSCTSSRARSSRRKASTSASSPRRTARSGTRSRCTGVESHAGPTPMNRRKDALLGASRIVELVNNIGHDHDPAACATCGMIEAYPNSRNVIPGPRRSSRSTSAIPMATSSISMDTALRAGLADIAAHTGVTARSRWSRTSRRSRSRRAASLPSATRTAQLGYSHARHHVGRRPRCGLYGARRARPR